MTNWTAPTEPEDRKPHQGDTIESAEAVESLNLGGDCLVVRDSRLFYHAVTNRTWFVYSDGTGSNINEIRSTPEYPVTVLWSVWDDEE